MGIIGKVLVSQVRIRLIALSLAIRCSFCQFYWSTYNLWRKYIMYLLLIIFLLSPCALINIVFDFSPCWMCQFMEGSQHWSSFVLMCALSFFSKCQHLFKTYCCILSSPKLSLSLSYSLEWSSRLSFHCYTKVQVLCASVGCRVIRSYHKVREIFFFIISVCI